MYTYSFVNKDLIKKSNSSMENLVELKNSLSEDSTHMKDSLIQNLLLSLEKNIRDKKDLKLFEIEKVFKKEKDSNIREEYNIAWVITSNKDVVYYEIQNIVKDYLNTIWITKFSFEKVNDKPGYAHWGRTADLIVRWQKVWIIWEIHPKIAKDFWVKSKIGFFEINLEKIKDMAFTTTKVKEISSFQVSNFDISFEITPKIKWSKVKTTIEKTDPKLIEKVELIDIYNDKEKLWDNTAITFKIYIWKMDSEVKDEEKNKLIQDIISRVEKLWAKHR